MTTPDVHPTSLPDYPAAHSMDTTWFAVDRNGEVGFFDSGEPGVVPVDWYAMPRLQWMRQTRGPEFSFVDHSLEDELLIEILRALPDRAVANVRQLRPPPGYRLRAFGRERCDAAHDWDVALSWDHEYWIGPCDDSPFLLLPTSGTVEDSIDGERLDTQVNDVDVWLVRSLRWADYQQIHQEGACLGCGWLHDVRHWLGLHSYDFDYGYTAYERKAAPAAPLSAAQLPGSVRRFVDKVRFDAVTFSQSTEIEVGQQCFCREYGAPWVIDHESRVVRLASCYKDNPRFIEEYRELYPRLAEWAQQAGFEAERLG